MTLQLRPYQQQAVDAVLSEFARVSSTLLVAPVGAGKTVMQASIIQDTIRQAPRARFVCAVHTRELVMQNMQAMVRAWPAAPVGVNSASLGQRSTHSQILFCSIQSVYKKAAQIGWCDCLIVDEAHLISRNGATMYQRLINELRDINPDMRVLGMSGTPYRMDSGSLTEGDDALFQSVAFDIPIAQLIEEGFLTTPISKATATGYDLSEVHMRGGDYVAAELERAVNVAAVTEAAVQEVVQFGHGRKAWIVFCAGVQHAKDVRDEFRRHGVSCETVEGNTAKGERDSIIRRFKEGQIRCLTNVNVLSTGFDHPGIDLVALMRPTKSASLYVQQVGRGLRLSPGKDNALILDFAGIIRALGPIDIVTPKTPGKGGGGAPTKICPSCEEIVHLSKRECPDCGYEFPEPERDDTPRHEGHAEKNLGILSTEAVPPQMVPVVDWRFDRHEKTGMPDSICVTFMAGLQEYREWVGFEHSGQWKQRAMQWWMDHGCSTPFPKSTDEAMERLEGGEAVMPATISVKPSERNKKYFDIVGRSFGKERKVA